MQQTSHNVTLYHFSDGSIYISARNDHRSPTEIVQAAFAVDKLNCKSGVFVKCRQGLLVSTQKVFDNLSKTEAESKRKTLIDFYRNSGHNKVLNVKQ